MPTGINLSIRDYREIIKKQMPPWMVTGDLDLFNYFSLSGHTYTEKIDSIIIDDFEYFRDQWTLGELKADLGILGTGDYDDSIIDLIEKIDSDDEVWIYTNPNIIIIDSLAVMQKKIDDRRNQLIEEMNPYLATVDGLLLFWEAIFQSERFTIVGELETDAEYMARAISELFGQSASLIVIRRTFDKYGLTNYYLEDSRKDPTHWSSYSAAMSVNLYLEAEDFDKITFLRQLFSNISVAGIRLFILCPATDHDCFGLNFGNSTDNSDYVVPPPFVPGVGLAGEGFGAKFGALFGN